MGVTRFGGHPNDVACQRLADRPGHRGRRARRRWLRERLHARPFGHAYYVGSWGEIMDAIMYIRQMAPSTHGSR